ncbi:hypothetical protein GCM10009801_18470 [Streptomyces albiaxialis]|uniref:PDZ domain-containing protein n=1 Tax=Streptomyces albiaxialis TaxID=329523 RepID=A0ABN2VUH3_9ACTN
MTSGTWRTGDGDPEALRRLITLNGLIPGPKEFAREQLVPNYSLVPRDRTLEVVRAVRTWFGLAVMLAVARRYTAADAMLPGMAAGFAVSVLIVCLAVPLCCLLLVLVTRSGSRADAARAAMVPIRTTGGFALLMSVYLVHLLIALGGGPFAPWLAGLGESTSRVLMAVALLLVLALALPLFGLMFWLIGYWACALWYGPQHLLRAVDGHPLLPALLAPCLPWGALLLERVRGGGSAELPPMAEAFTSYGGPITVTVLSLWEIVRVRRAYGATFRGGPYPPRAHGTGPEDPPAYGVRAFGRGLSLLCGLAVAPVGAATLLFTTASGKPLPEFLRPPEGAGMGVAVRQVRAPDETPLTEIDKPSAKEPAVAPGGPADRAGLREGDVLLKVNRDPVGTYGALVEALSGYDPGDTVEVKALRRPGRELTVEMELGDPEKQPVLRAPTPRPGQLGVRLDMDADGVKGARVDEHARGGGPGVTPGSPADRAGIAPGDVITALDGRPVREPDDLLAGIARRTAGEKVTVTFTHKGAEREKKVTLAKRQ